MTPARRLVVSVCRRECGIVVMPVERGGRRRRLDATAILKHLDALVAQRGLAEHVEVREACAGGCRFLGPNVSVTIYPPRRPGERDDHVAVAWKTYVGSLKSLDSLARIVDENL
jgi:hypothetical protein